MPMSRVVVIIVAALIAWLLTGRHATLMVDRFFSGSTHFLPVAPMRCDGGGLIIGNVALTFGGLDNLRSDIQLSADSANRLVLSTARQTFLLGPRTNPASPAGRPPIDFAPESGDKLSFTRRTSRLCWPTPFEFHILGGQSPWWKRYVYYQLLWKKPAGAQLVMRWRFEQQYYAGRGWTQPAMMWNSQTGLLPVEIRPVPAGTGNAVVPAPL